MSARWLKPRHAKAFSSGACGMPQNAASYCASAACKAASAAAVSPASVKAAARSRTSPCRAATVPTRHRRAPSTMIPKPLSSHAILCFIVCNYPFRFWEGFRNLSVVGL